MQTKKPMTALKLSVDRTVPQKPIESTEMLQCQFAVYVTLVIVISVSTGEHVNYSMGLLMLLL